MKSRFPNNSTSIPIYKELRFLLPVEKVHALLFSAKFNPLSPNSVQDQFSPYNYPYTVKR